MGWRMRFTYEKYHNPTLNSVDEEEEHEHEQELVTRKLNRHRQPQLFKRSFTNYEEKPKREMAYNFFFKY